MTNQVWCTVATGTPIGIRNSDKVRKINFNLFKYCYLFTKSYVWPLVRIVDRIWWTNRHYTRVIWKARGQPLISVFLSLKCYAIWNNGHSSHYYYFALFKISVMYTTFILQLLWRRYLASMEHFEIMKNLNNVAITFT